MRIDVTFYDIESLEAAVKAVAAVVSTESRGADETTPAYRAERALDSALLAAEALA